MVTTNGQILTTLDRNGVLARHRIADATGLTRATVSKSVQMLIDRGIVVETEKLSASIRGGPRPTLLTINPTAMNFIGLDIRREKFTGALVDLGGNMSATTSRNLAMGAPTEELLTAIDDILDDLRIRATGSIGAIGIGSVGPILTHEGTIRSRHFTALNGVPLVRRLADATGLPVELRIGAVAAAHGEERIAASQSAVVESVAFVVIDYGGIGLGLTSRGEGWITDHGGVGELGHVSIDWHGRPCPCGRLGCLVQYASGQALLEEIGADPREDPGNQLARIAQDANEGDETARVALLKAGEYLGQGLVDVDRLLRPERMVVGAPHPHLADWYLRGAMKYINSLPDAIGERPLQSRLHLTSMGSAAIAYGAAALQLKNFLADPERQFERTGNGRKAATTVR